MTTTPPTGPDDARPGYDPDAPSTFAPIRDEDPPPPGVPTATEPAVAASKNDDVEHTSILAPADGSWDSSDDESAAAEAATSGRGGKLVAGLIVALLAALGLGWYAAGAYAGDKVPPGTTVRGVAIGDLRPAAAEARLKQELDPRANTPIKVNVDAREATVRPVAAGIALDAGQTVVNAGAVRSWSPARLWAYYTGGGPVAPAVTIDQDKFQETLARLGKGIDAKPVDGAIAFKRSKTGVEAKITEPATGEGIDSGEARQALTRAYLTSGPVELPTVEIEPEIKRPAVDAAMQEFVEPALSGPVTLRLGKAPIKVRPRAYTRAITLEPRDGELVPTLNQKKLLTALKPAMRTVGDTPEDARFEVRNGRPVLIPAKVGVTFDKADLSGRFLELVVQPAGQRTQKIKAANAQPDFTTADARKLGIKRRVSSESTNFPYAEYRNVNLPRAASLIDNTLLKPGETFSLNGIVGERTAENGFVEGYTIQNGIFKKDFGGGVSQIATTTFSSMFFAGLEDVEHRPHSVYIDRYPVGREATVVWGALDLKFKNDTKYGVLIDANVTKATPSSQGTVTVSMYSTKVWDIKERVGSRYKPVAPGRKVLTTPDCEPATGISGFSIDVYRDFRRPGSSSVVRTEKFHTDYVASPTVECKAPPRPRNP